MNSLSTSLKWFQQRTYSPNIYCGTESFKNNNKKDSSAVGCLSMHPGFWLDIVFIRVKNLFFYIIKSLIIFFPLLFFYSLLIRNFSSCLMEKCHESKVSKNLTIPRNLTKLNKSRVFLKSFRYAWIDFYEYLVVHLWSSSMKVTSIFLDDLVAFVTDWVLTSLCWQFSLKIRACLFFCLRVILSYKFWFI